MPNMSSVVWKKFTRVSAGDLAIGIISGFVIANIFFLNPVAADVYSEGDAGADGMVALTIEAMQNEDRSFGELPVAMAAAPRRTFTIPVTAYTSDSAQTDETPCIAARGFDLCKNNEENVVAANFLPIGTKLRIPELYGTRVFTVVDRMNARYDRRVDVWMKNYADAKHFGLKRAMIEVL